MSKSLKRDRMRTVINGIFINGIFGRRTATRRGLQDPQQLQGLVMPARARP